MKYFAPFCFDVAEGTLWRGAQQVPLTAKAAALLSCLIGGAGAWVSKTDIMAAVWPDTHVQPDNVKVLVREIRQALGDTPQTAAYIKSAPGRGYAFIAPVSDGLRPDLSPVAVGPRAPIFVNRGPELAALADSLDAARASSRRLVVVRGEHGVGKTALCDTFIRTASASGPVRTCHGQCFDGALPHEPYYAFLDALVGLERRHPGLVPSVLSEHAPWWLAQFPQWINGRAIPAHPVRILDELTAALDVIAHDIPLVVVIEDLQWADADTVQALVRVASSRVPSRLLIVATACDGEWAAGVRAQQRLLAAASAGDAHCSTLALGPLTHEHVERYLDARFGPACLSELATAVHHATNGNPFMMVHAIDCLVQRGLVVLDAGGWRRDATLDAIAKALPETLGTAIARQLDHLDASERETLEAAAVIGLEFTASSVAAALARPIDPVRTVLVPLARRGQLIVAGAGSPRAAHTLFRFRHPLYADVIAQHAPLLRQLRIVERVTRAREVTLRRA